MRSYLKPMGLLSTGWIVSSGAVLTLSGAASAATGTATLFLSTNTLQPNLAGQTIDLNITSTGGVNSIEGTDVDVQLNSGNPGSNTTPDISLINLTAAGTIFSASTDETLYENPNIWVGARAVSSPSPETDTGTLAVLTISTVGMTSGTSFTIQFDNVSASAVNTNVIDETGSGSNIVLSGDGTTLTAGGNIQGTINVVPEAASLSMLGLSAGGMLMRRRRRRA
jgi:hypothetical protein